MTNVEVPPGPWRWVAPGAPDGDSDRADGLVASDGTWVVHSQSGQKVVRIHPAAKPLISQAHLLERLPDLLQLWRHYCEAERPVAQADALLQFANAMAHLQWDYAGELDD